MNLNVQLVQDLASLESYAPQWQALAERQYDSLAAMQLQPFVTAYIKAHRLKDWQVILVHDATGTLLGVLPLVRLNTQLPGAVRPLQLAVIIGARNAPYLEPLIDPQYRAAVWSALHQMMQQHMQLDGVLLGPLHETSLNLYHLLTTLPQAQRDLRQVCNNHHLNTRYCTYPEYASQHKRSIIKDAQYSERRLQKHGRLHYHHLDNLPSVQSSLSFIAGQMQSAFADQLIYNDLPAWTDTLSRLAAAEPQALRSTTITVDQQTIAAALFLNHRDRWSFLLTAYHKDWRKYSPGKVLLYWNIQQAFRQGKQCCMGAGHFPYKQQWANECYHLNLIVWHLTDDARQYWRPYTSIDQLMPLINAG